MVSSPREAMGGLRARFEARFGALGTGARELRVDERSLTVAELMGRLGLAADGCRGIDAREVAPGRFVVRYLDADDQRIVAHEFDRTFRCLGETRVHVAEWIGEDRWWSFA